MDLSRIKKGLFAVKEPIEKKENVNSSASKQPVNPKITYTDYGFQQASRLGGTTPGLTTCLHKIYNDFKQEVKDDFAKQEELKKPCGIIIRSGSSTKPLEILGTILKPLVL